MSEFGQDTAVLEYFDYRRGGFFVDVGAAEPIRNNNTFRLENEYGWNGIAIEPHSTYAARWRKSKRTCHFVEALVLNEERKVEYNQSDYGSWTSNYFVGDFRGGPSGIGPNGVKRKLTSRTLTSILDEHNAPRHIEFLSIDVERAELWVLQGIDWDKYSFGVIMVERTAGPNSGPERIAYGKQVQNYLEHRGYHFLHKVGADDMYHRPKTAEWQNTSKVSSA